MAMNMLDQTPDDFMSDMESEMDSSAKAAERKKLKEGGLRQFKMPKTANGAGGTRVATIRYLRPFDQGTTVIEHGKFQGFRTVCPAEFGFDCPYCARLMKKWNVPRDELYHDANAIAKYCGKAAAGVDFDTKKVFIWDVWYYEAREDEGEQQVFAWSINPQSPISPIHKLNLLRYVRAQAGQTPKKVTEYDIELTQFGESTKRTFSANDTSYREFPFADKVKPLSHDDLRFGYAISITYDDDAWLAKLQDARKKSQTPARPAVKAKVAEPVTVADALSLEFEEN